MDTLKKIWYGSFQFGLNIGSRALYWRKPRAEVKPTCVVPVVYTAEHCAEPIRRIRAMA